MASKFLLIGSTAISALCSIAVASAQQTNSPPTASATVASGGADDSLQEIVVTSTRRETTVQTTAAAITALSAFTLEQKSVQSVEDLSRVAIGVQVSNSQGEAQVYIRGIGTPLRGAGLGEGSTALLTDGIYIANAADASSSYYDLERIEVLRGPQGTLYGRNATSGAINVITKNPTTDYQGEADLTVGNYGRFSEFAAVSGPIVDDTVLARLAIQKNNHDGYTTLIRPDGSTSHVEGQDDFSARLKVEFRPSDNLKMLLTGDMYSADDTQVAYQYFGPGFPGTPAYEAAVAAAPHVTTPFSRTQYSDINFFDHRHIEGVSDKITYDLGDYTFTSTTAYRKVLINYQNDLGFTSTFVADQHHGEDSHQITQDFLISSPTDQTISWIAGASYFDQADTLVAEYFIPTLGIGLKLNNRVPGLYGADPTCCILALDGSTTNTSYAGYGEATVRLMDNLNFKAGARYSTEQIGGSQNVRVIDVGNQYIPFNVVPNLTPKNFYSFTPKVSLEYTFSPEIFAYISYTKGFKSGGFNIGDFAQNVPFSPEKVGSLEGGIKSKLFNNRTTLDLTVFNYDYNNLQVQEDINNSVVVQNAATANIHGVELEGTSRVLSHTQIDYGLTYLDAEFTQFNTIEQLRPTLGIQNLSGRSLPKAPKYTVAFGIQQDQSLGELGNLTGRIDYTWKSTEYQDVFNEPSIAQKPVGTLSARLTFETPSGKWHAALFGVNLTDEKIITNAFFTGAVIGAEALGQFAPPRTYGAEIGYKF